MLLLDAEGSGSGEELGGEIVQVIDGGVLGLGGRDVGSLQGAEHGPEGTAEADEVLVHGLRAFRESGLCAEEFGYVVIVRMGVQDGLRALHGGLDLLEVMPGDEREVELGIEAGHGCFDARIFS